ncbi:hypothetical protein O0I10_004352 [Lichtheimia ornata]|uniref:Uncharacterized protein n=1 Tax=Lichtheimia ornata TaxID=688661 RepID=A0AAD7V6D7_9FUNG|nr:uncharacterized protein O0I10_004352 [Lichtheimia ornata]KAJ8659759.1 hypothetical protein O0I10_004352 [Lichtheimia ornata]
MATATTTTTTSPNTNSSSTTSTCSKTLSVDVSDLIQILQVQLPQLHHETIIYEHRQQMEDTKEQYRTLCKEADHLRKKLLAVVQDNNTYRKAQERMESQIYAQEQDLVQAQKDNQLLKKRNKDLEKRLENELQNYESDRLLWQQREADLTSEIKRYATQGRHNNGHPRRARSATASNIWSRSEPSIMRGPSIGMSPLMEERATTPTIDGVSARDAKIRVQDKLIADFKAELEQQKMVLHEAMTTAEAQAQRVDGLEQELASLQQVNASLMEDNESYQMLLHEKTIAGEFPVKKSELSTATSSLAAELNKVQQQGGDGGCTCQHAGAVKKLSEDNRLLQESNKALSLYMNKILRKIVENQDLVDVLNIDDDDDDDGQPQQQPKAVRDTSTSTTSTAVESTTTTTTTTNTAAAETCKKTIPPKKDDQQPQQQSNHSSFRLSGSHWTTPIKWVASRARAESLSKLM